MKTLTLISAIFLTNVANSQVPINSKKLIGTWEYSKKNNKEGFVECPDFIIFEVENKYSVLNECYGNDGNNPIIETGIWNLNVNKKQIFLNRKFLINYYFLGSNNKNVPLKIVKITDKQLILLFGKRNEYSTR